VIPSYPDSKRRGKLRNVLDQWSVPLHGHVAALHCMYGLALDQFQYLQGRAS
jgi:hypothetical protein